MASYFMARRLDAVDGSAEAIAGGDLSAKVPETIEEDEIGQLADTFNVMADPLRSASPRSSTSATASRCCSTT